MTKRICSFFAAYPVWFAKITLALKRLTFGCRTPEPRKRTLVSGRSRMIFGAYPYVADVTESNTKWGKRRFSGIAR